MKTLKILGIVGSLRKNSLNKKALEEAVKTAPKGVIFDTFNIGSLPLFNEDLESILPKSVIEFKQKIEQADAILFVTPEYNYSIPGVLKNALDWGSRPAGKNSWNNKPAAIMGVSIGSRGTVRAQLHLRQVFVTLNIHALNKPEILIGPSSEIFDKQGNIIDEDTKTRIKELVIAIADWTRRLS